MSAKTETSNIVIRDVEGSAELRAVEKLQKEIWGLPDLDIVPLSQLVAVKEAGGVLLGAYDDATLIGFIYGFAGYEHGQMAHHSHMLAVLPAYRNCNLGQKLKLAQRDRVLAQSVKIMTWTFDPLQSLNAYFNFRKLGVVADRYFENFYGEDAPSFLHRNGTDRLWVTWPLVARAKEEEDSPEIDLEQVIPLVQFTAEESPVCSTLEEGLSFEQAVIEIPDNINELQERSSDLTWVWRVATRWAFTKAIDAGYLVVDFQRLTRGDQKLGRYVLSRGKTLADYL